ncbi:MAG: EamA family transporter RarD [Cellvibrio sp.]|uniref:EamA family transporter RarD n=1 Tax=Cellvibrio sp. TaxID=1965322 RepID=UPI0031B0E65B
MSAGIRFSISASIIFGLIYYYVQFLGFLDSQQGFGWRVILALPFITLMIAVMGELPLIKQVVDRVIKNPLLALGVLTTAVLSGVQMWLFTWGAFAGRGLAVSLGYFLLPIVMVIIGRFIYQDKLSSFQKAATVLAAIGVAYSLSIIGYLPWETLLVALGYPAYFMLRKKIGLDHLGGFWWDMVLSLPIAFYFISSNIPQLTGTHWLWIIGFGAISALGLCCYILASRLLTFSLFGLLSYIEPILLSMVSILVGEKILANEWPTYLCIWLAVVLLMWDGVRSRRISKS